jgi:hypothetical protein
MKKVYFVKKIQVKKLFVDFFWLDHVFVLSISPENCQNQHFLGATNMRYVLSEADFHALLYFFREFPPYFLKYGNPYKHCLSVLPGIRRLRPLTARSR